MFTRSLAALEIPLLCVFAASCADPVSSPRDVPSADPAPPHVHRDEDRIILPNSPPNTTIELAPATLFFSETPYFRWSTTDVNGRVVGSQYQLVETDEEYFDTDGAGGTVLRSVQPPANDGGFHWSSLVYGTSQSFREVPSGFFEFRVRAVDDRAEPDPTPAVHRFRVFHDTIPPVPTIGIPEDDGCGPLDGRTHQVFWINATDTGDDGPAPRSWLEYRVQLRSDNHVFCNSHLVDPFTDWTPFPDDSDAPIPIGIVPPTVYTDLEGNVGCSWTFTLEVRDPPGNRARRTCQIWVNR